MERDIAAEMQGDAKPSQTEDEWELGQACAVIDETCEACQ